MESQSFIYLLENFQNFQNDPYIDQDQTREGDQLLVSLHVYDGEGGAFVKTCDFALQVADTIKPNIDCPASPQTISPDSDGKYRLPDESDWRQAIIKGARNYKIYQIIGHMPFIYDEYLFRLSNFIAHADTSENNVYDEYLAFTLLYRQQVNEGRRQLGDGG